MSGIARSGNARAIRPGGAIPQPSQQDEQTAAFARLAASFNEQAYQLAQTAPDSREHRLALHMATIANKLPRNNLRLLVRPLSPRKEWFEEAHRRWRVAEAAVDLADSRRDLARHLDQQDGGLRAAAANLELRSAEAELTLATEDALRTLTTRKADVATKQSMVGKREWALQYRPEWQAMVDEDLARHASKGRQKQEAQA